MAEKITVDGRCHCGSIEVTAQVDPGMVIACHCTDCQMIGGGPYRAVAISDAEDLSITGPRASTSRSPRAATNGFRHSVVTVVHSCTHVTRTSSSSIFGLGS